MRRRFTLGSAYAFLPPRARIQVQAAVHRVSTLPPLTRFQALGIAGLLLLTSFLAPTPPQVGPAEGLYALIFSGAMFAWVLTVIGRRAIALSVGQFALLAMVLIFGLSAAWALPSGTDPSTWGRGLVPFLNVLLVLPAAEASRHPTARAILVTALCLAAIVIAVQIYAVVALHLPDAISERNLGIVQSFLPPQAFSPLLVGGTAYALGAAFPSTRGRRIHVLLLAGLLPAILLTFLKTLLVIFAILGLSLAARTVERSWIPLRNTIAGWFSFASVSWPRMLARIAIAAMAAVFVVALMWAYGGGFVAAIAGGITGNTRIAEYAAVLEHWSASPVLGRGLGFEYAYLRPELGLVWTGTYTHNLLSFALLTTGLLGAAATTAAVVVLGVVAWRAMRASSDTPLVGMAVAVWALLLYAMVQATFRTLSFWLVIALAIGILAALPASGTSGRRSADA